MEMACSAPIAAVHGMLVRPLCLFRGGGRTCAVSGIFRYVVLPAGADDARLLAYLPTAQGQAPAITGAADGLGPVGGGPAVPPFADQPPFPVQRAEHAIWDRPPGKGWTDR